MNFSEQLNTYISILNCSAKELSESSSISTAVISRYRNNQRTPEKNSELISQLANGIVKIASKNGLSNILFNEVYSNLNNTLTNKSAINYENLSKNFDNILSLCNINMSEMARYLIIDPSSLSRIRTGQRKPANLDFFIDSVCSYIIHRYNSNSNKKTISTLIGCNLQDISNQSDYLSRLKNWICSEATETHNYINEFLTKLNDFNLDDYIHTIHFDELKVPTIPFQLPTSKNYYGIEEMKKGELDFFKATVFSKSKDSVFMCSDMPMEDMAKDIEFGKKWMFAIAMTLKKGLHLNIIHNLNRPFNEMLIGLESWIPIYMTGQISPYYLKEAQNNLYHHLTYVSGNFALTGECINNYHSKGKYYFTNNKDEVSYYKEKSNFLLEKASPLMEIHLKNSSNIYNAFITSDSETIGNRRRILSSLPLFTIPKNTLLEILNHNFVSSADTNKILKLLEQEKDIAKNITSNGTLLDEFTELTEEEFNKHPVFLSLSNIFYEKQISYTYKEYLEHLNATKKYADNTHNYIVQTNNRNAFKNIQISIHEKKWVTISKENNPTIHFVIRHPKLCNAIENFIIPISEDK